MRLFRLLCIFTILCLFSCTRFDFRNLFVELPAPTFNNIQPGTFSEPAEVPDYVILELPVGAVGIRYSLSPEGSPPENWQEYSAPIGLTSGTTTITAYAYSTNTTVSSYISGTFVRTAAPVRTTPGAGAYAGATQPIELHTATEDASIWYTIDGSEPSPGGVASILYNSTPLELAAEMILEVRAIATLSGRENSPRTISRFLGGTMLFVAGSGEDTNSGLDPLSPTRTIASALNLANSINGSTLITIKVAGGNYTEAGLRIDVPVRISGSWTSGFASQDKVGSLTTIRSEAAVVGSADNPVVTMVFRRSCVDSALDNCRLEAPVVGTVAPLYSAALMILSSGVVAVDNSDIVGVTGAGRILNAGLIVSNSSPSINASLLQGGVIDLLSVDTLSGSYGAVIDGELAQPSLVSCIVDVDSGVVVPGLRCAGLLYANRSAGIVQNTSISGGDADFSAGVIVRGLAQPVLGTNTTVVGRSAGSGIAYGVYINGASPQLTGDNLDVSAGLSGAGNYESYGVYCIGADAAHYSNQVIGGAGTVTIRAGNSGITGQAVGVLLSGSGTTGRLEGSSLHIIGRELAGGPATGVRIVDNAAPYIDGCRIESGAAGGTVAQPAIGLAIESTVSSTVVVEDCRISAGASAAGSYGVYVKDVGSLKLRRNMIYGAEIGSRVGVYLDAATVPLDGVLLMANIIMPTSTAAGGGHYGIYHRAGDGVFSKPLIINNTVYAGGHYNSAFNNRVVATGAVRAARPVLINNIFQAPLGGYAVQEQTVAPNSTDPQVLRNNNLFGDEAHYDDGGLTSTDIVAINNGDFSGDAECGGNLAIDCTTGFVGGALPATLGQFLAFDWNLAAAVATLKTTGYDLALDPDSLLGTALAADDLFDLAGNPLSAGWPIGALATP